MYGMIIANAFDLYWHVRKQISRVIQLPAKDGIVIAPWSTAMMSVNEPANENKRTLPLMDETIDAVLLMVRRAFSLRGLGWRGCITKCVFNTSFNSFFYRIWFHSIIWWYRFKIFLIFIQIGSYRDPQGKIP